MGNASMSARMSNVLPRLAPLEHGQDSGPADALLDGETPAAHPSGLRGGRPHLLEGQLRVLTQLSSQRDQGRLPRTDVLAEVDSRGHLKAFAPAIAMDSST